MEAMDPAENPNYDILVKRLGLSQAHLSQAANFTNNKYPSIELEFEPEDPDNITAGTPAYIKIKIEREVDEDEMVDIDTTVHAPFYPVKKMENWWLVVGEESTKTLLAIKRVTIGRRLNLRLEYTIPTPGKHELKLFLMSDSYVGVDQDPSFNITVAEGMDDDDEDVEDMEE
jgi:pre-mRNA-splicing helicase BRR2